MDKLENNKANFVTINWTYKDLTFGKMYKSRLLSLLLDLHGQKNENKN